SKPSSSESTGVDRAQRAPSRGPDDLRLWTVYRGTPLLKASLAHESAHIAARDVGSCRKLLSTMKAGATLVFLTNGASNAHAEAAEICERGSESVQISPKR